MTTVRDLEALQRYIVRLGETDDAEPVLLYRVPLPNGRDRVLIRPHERAEAGLRRGFLIALLLATPFWAAVGAAVWMVWR